jgi:polyisoprenoid-binding protein YceI
MKAALTWVVLLTGIFSLQAQQYRPVDEKSDIKFTIRNFGFNTEGSLKGLKGAIQFNPSSLAGSSFNVSVDVNTINTGIDARDKHLKGDEYFDAGRFPVISFVSTAITSDNNGYKVTGTLTIKGVSKTIAFPFTVSNSGSTLVFAGSFTINRRDFGVGGSSAVLSNSVAVDLKVAAAKG